MDLAYKVIIGESNNSFNDPLKYVNNSYANGTTDEFILPAFNKAYSKQEIALEDNDAVIFANFRPDRARQLSHVIFGSNYYDYKPQSRKNNLYFVTMMNYEGITPSCVAYPPLSLKNTLGQVVADNNLSQLRIAETEKYAHVTFFFDGGKEINYPNEQKILINSPKVATYDLKPEMSAIEVTDKLLPQMDNTDIIIVNYANGDMVGHTGNIEATIKAVETVDAQIARILQKAKQTNTTLFITADHGNADVMRDEKGNPVTKHTTNPVPFIITDSSLSLLEERGALCDIAPTMLSYLKINIPCEMTGKVLIK
ncbi:MAG: 2,3-bisphosphoglycerate-independent phosphoglycerate mutase [Mycoplasmoidaceae bacterium]|nr:2,3-bisphosphoglycerate-independent phosphoglycerate mutase [Mycoplasmoidaceae bacterium]